VTQSSSVRRGRKYFFKLGFLKYKMVKRLSTFFGVIIKRQTYLNLFYLLLAFVLGIFYFTFLTTGLSLGLGLLITLFGLPILVGMMFLWRWLAIFEIQQARTILGIKIAPVKVKKSKGFWKTIQMRLNDSFTWKSLVYLFIKFPLGIISFVILMTLLSISISLIGVPIMYSLSDSGIVQTNFCIAETTFCFVNGYLSATLWGILGLLLLFAFLHLLNGLARVSGLLAKTMLGN